MEYVFFKDGIVHSHTNETTTHTHADGTVHTHDDETMHTHLNGTTHTHADGTVHTHDDETTHTHADGTVHSHDDTIELASISSSHSHSHGSQSCEVEDMADYNMPLRIGSIFIILATSAVGNLKHTNL